MYYQLEDGRTIEISLEMFLNCSDQDLKALASYDIGVEINNPMHGSVIHAKGQRKDEDQDTLDE